MASPSALIDFSGVILDCSLSFTPDIQFAIQFCFFYLQKFLESSLLTHYRSVLVTVTSHLIVILASALMCASALSSCLLSVQHLVSDPFNNQGVTLHKILLLPG